jgi:6-phosphogluconolactonase
MSYNFQGAVILKMKIPRAVREGVVMKQTVYTASPESQQIHVWSLEADGKLTLVQVVDAPGQVQPMVVSPNKEYLYVGVRPEFRVLPIASRRITGR